MNNFKPMLCPNEATDLKTIVYPNFRSKKVDGIRFICHHKLGMVTRSLKPIQNKQLRDKFEYIMHFARDYDLIIDGEIYAHEKTFQEISRAVMTQDFMDEKTIKKLKKEMPDIDVLDYILELLGSMKFVIFDTINGGIEGGELLEFENRYNVYKTVCEDLYTRGAHHTYAEQIITNNKEEVEEAFKESISLGYEGLILKSLRGRYKFGRATMNQGLTYKVKPFIEKSGIIKGVVQATIVDPNAKKTINELGRSVTSKKKGDRILVESASGFVIDYEGEDLTVTIAATDYEKSVFWEDREDYIGKEVCYKSMEVGQKEGGLPRHPIMTRVWRKDE